jgi:hypothetical protein
MILLIAALMVLAGVSCSKKDAGTNVGTIKKPEGHQKMVTDYISNLEEMKKTVVERVNGADITKYDVFTRASKLTPNYLQRGQQMTPELEKKVMKEALDELVFRELAIQEAIRQQMKVPQKEIDAMLQEYKMKIGPEKEYEAYLKKKNITEASIIKLIEREQLFRRITVKEIFEKVKKEGAGKEQEVEKRKRAWEQELKKNAKIEILLLEAEKKPVDKAQKQPQVAK